MLSCCVGFVRSRGENDFCVKRPPRKCWSAISRAINHPRPLPLTAHAITAREREVLAGIAQGQSNKVIARALGLSPKTVEKHRSNLMKKLQLRNAAAITMYAIRNGLAGDGLMERRPDLIFSGQRNAL